MGGVEQCAAGRLVDSARLHPNEPVLDEINAAYTMTSANGVERCDEIDCVELCTVHRDGSAVQKTDGDLFRVVGGIFGRGRQHEQISGRRRRWLFEDPTLMRDVPEVAIARIDLVPRCCNRDPVRFSVSDCILTATDIPFAPWRDDRQVGRERGVSQLESYLVVPFPGAAMCKCISTNAAGDLHLSTSNEWPAHRGAEEVFTTVDSTSAEGGPHELFHKFLAQVFDVALIGTRGDCLRSYAFQLLALSYVGGDADDASAVALLEPGDDDRRVKPARVGKGDCTDHGCLNKYSE